MRVATASDHDEGPTFYRWADGSSAQISVTLGPRPSIWVHVVDPEAEAVREGTEPMTHAERADVLVAAVNFWPEVVGGRPALYVPTLDIQSVRIPAVARKIRGLCLDLGVNRMFPHHRGLVTTSVSVPSEVPYPRVVDDALWERRYDIGRRLVGTPLRFEELDPFLGIVAWMRIEPGRYQIDRDGTSYQASQVGFTARYTVEQHTAWASTPEGVVDAVLEAELVLPKSALAAWEAANVERGEFLFPSVEEVELFRMLGETLPFFWGPDPLTVWLAERGELPP